MVTRPVTWLFSWDLMLCIPICSWDMNLSSCSLPPGPGLGSHVHPLCPLQQLQPGPALAKAPLPIASCGELDAVSSKSVPYIFLPKSGRWAGPRYEPRRNVCSAPEVNPCFPGAGSVGWEVYFQFELVGTAYNHFSLSLGAFVPNYPFSLVASDSSDMLSPGTFLWKVFYLSILFFLVVDLPQNHNNLPGQFCKSCWGIPLCNGEPDYCLRGDAPYLGYCFRFPASFL